MHQKHSTSLNLSLFLAVMSCPAGTIIASETPSFTVTIHVYNYAGVPEKTLAKAKHESGRIFRNSGLTVLWEDHALTPLIDDIDTTPLTHGTALTLFYDCSRSREKGQAQMRWARPCPSSRLRMFL
jgi:hypothetical protein